MKAGKHKIIITTLSLIALTVYAGVLTSSANTYAESSSANASVTVANTITLTLTGGDLVIDDLTPGNAADSNVITASVTSNSPYGFHLAATTGTSTGTTSLVNTADSNFTFTNLNANKATLSNFSDNTWGYTYSTDNGTTWVSGDYATTATTGYNGLPLDNNDSGATSTTLFNSDSYLGSKSVQFKIGAKSATTQAAGTYTNTINFYAVTNPEPLSTLYMQDIATWKDTVLPNIGNETIATDARDNKEYYVAKLPDGNIWMTQNLDHNISSSYNYNSTNTDVPANWSDTLTSTYATDDTTWNYSTTAPESYDPGDRCWNGTLDPNYSTNLDTGTTACSSIATTPDHYHIGNYYNWTASVAMQDSSSYTADNTDVNQSICPAGWMLPKKTGSGSFYDLINGRYTAGTSGNIQSSPVYFVYGGYWTGSSYEVSSYGYYWSSVVRDSDDSYYLYFSVDGYLSPQLNYARYGGYLVRCLAR